MPAGGTHRSASDRSAAAVVVRVAGLLVALAIPPLGTGWAQPGDQAALSPRNANYTIEVELDPEAKTLVGRQRVEWRNIRAEPTRELWFHLYWNAWRNDRSTWMVEDRWRGRSDNPTPRPGDWSYLVVESARLVDRPSGEPVDLMPTFRFATPDDQNRHDRTVAVLELPRQVAPGETVTVDMEWRAKVPRTFARTGFRGDFFFIAHWFPKLGVFEGDGWNCHQYHAATEYYSDFGIYDVSITLPQRFVVGATGVEVERRTNDDGTRTVRFEQADVHAFTWAASPDFRVAHDRFERRGLPPVDIELLYQSEHERQVERHFHATKAALELYGSWYGPYPYGNLTVVDPAYGSGAGGMEYPTLFTAGTRLFNPFGGGSPEGVTIHEAGHQFWYGVVANNEFEHAWIDEGLNSFSDARVYDLTYGPERYVERYFQPPGTEGRGFLPLLIDDLEEDRDVYGNRMSRFRAWATTEVMNRPTYRYFPSKAGHLSYTKTALWLATLERHLGWETLQQILSTFYQRYSFRHPTPADFFAVADEVSGRDLAWFFDQVYRSSNEFDYAIESADSRRLGIEGLTGSEDDLRLERARAGGATGSYRSVVVVRREGEAVFPVDVLLVFEDGEEIVRRWDGERRWLEIVEIRPARLAYAEVDPDEILLLDVDRSNNSYTLEPGARFVATKLAARWIGWLQDLLVAFAFFS